MFRLGSLLFIPAYASVTIYRVFASADDDGNFLLMTCAWRMASVFSATDMSCRTLLSTSHQHVSHPVPSCAVTG